MSNGRSTAPAAAARTATAAMTHATTFGRRTAPHRAPADAAELCREGLHEYLAARLDVTAAERHPERRAAVQRHVAALAGLRLLARRFGASRDADALDPLTAQRVGVICDIVRIQPLAAAARTYDELYSTSAALTAAVELATALDDLSGPRAPAPLAVA